MRMCQQIIKKKNNFMFLGTIDKQGVMMEKWENKNKVDKYWITYFY